MAKSIWDKLADLFKTDSQKAQERQEQINAALDGEKDILDDLKALDEEYKNSLPKEEEVDIDALFPAQSELKELEYEAESDEDIAARAELENSLKKQEETKKLEDKLSEQIAVYDGNREKAEQTLKDGYEQLKSVYDELKKRTENDVLKRGLGRSSIATERLGALDEAHIKSAGKLQASYAETSKDIDDAIARLEADKNDALEKLDIKYALELEDRIAKLKADRDKTALEYQKYNDSVRKQNEQAKSKRQKEIDAYLAAREKQKTEAQAKQDAYEKENGYTGEKGENYAKRYEIASDFYSSLDPEIAYDALAASPNMKYYLGYYYDKLLNALKATKVDSGSSQKRYY